MPRTNLPHIVVSNRKDAKPYQSTGKPVSSKRPIIRNKLSHVRTLIRRFDRVRIGAITEKRRREAESLPARDGFYIRIRSFQGHRLSYDRLELRSANIRILHHRETEEGEEKTEEAILYIPFSKVQSFLDRLENYQRDIEKDKVRNASQKDLIEYIASIQEAVFDQFWQDPIDKKPIQDSAWVEVWIWTDDLTMNRERSERLDGVKNICRRLQKDVREENLHLRSGL